MTALKDTIPKFIRRPRERAPVKLDIEYATRPPAALPPLPRSVIHGGVSPVNPDFLTPGEAKTRIHDSFRVSAGKDEMALSSRLDGPASEPSPADDSVVDLTARRGAAAAAEPAPHKMSRALQTAFEADSGDPGEDDDAAFQVTLPRSVIRQIRMFAAEEGTTHRAVVLRALRAAGLEIPEGADVDRRAIAAKRRQQA